MNSEGAKAAIFIYMNSKGARAAKNIFLNKSYDGCMFQQFLKLKTTQKIFFCGNY